MKRILNLSHNDLDGIAAAAAIKIAHPGDHVVTKFCSYSDIHENFLKGLTSKGLGFDRIVLSDISIKIPGANFFDNQEKWLAHFQIPEAVVRYTKNGGELVFLDHHEPQATKMSWYYRGYTHPLTLCRATDELGYKRAGSELAGTYLKQVNPQAATEVAINFLELAGDYDVWRNPRGLGGVLAMGVELIEDNFSTLNEFVKIMQSDTLFKNSEYSPFMAHYMGLAQQKYETALNLAWNTKINHTSKVTEIYTNWFSSLIAMEVYEKTKGVVIVRSEKDRNKAKHFSFRKHNDVNVHLGNFASQYGGGGHAEAAGLKLNPEKGITHDYIIESFLSYLHCYA